MKNKLQKMDYLLGAILFLLPFLHVCIGINITDQGYNLANFKCFPDMNQTWMISTLVANIIGKIFTWLPFGKYMLGMNVYCTLLLSVLSVVLFRVLKKDFSKYAVFVGLIIAICLSWAPKVTLYQYLSYYLFDAAAIVLLMGIRKEDRRYMFGAGCLLAVNLFVRFPNILQVALIAVVVLAAILRKKRLVELIKDILVCVAGYLAVALSGLVMIEWIWGRGAYMGMISSLFAMTDTAIAYSPFSMFTSVIYAYLENLYWFKFFLVEAIGGFIVYGFLKKKWMKQAFVAALVMGFVAILGFCWHRDVLNTVYASYHSIYTWGTNLLMLGILLSGMSVILPGISFEMRLYGLTALVIIGITPLGSNNVLYSNFNNLYLVAPVLAGMICKLWDYSRIAVDENNEKKIWQISGLPIAVVSILLVGVILVQSFMFHGAFVFGDSVNSDKSYAYVEENKLLTGMLSTEEQAESLGSLSKYVAENEINGRKAIVWSEAPILYYLLDVECAIGHFWPWLASYPYEEFEADIEGMEEYPVIIYQADRYADLIQGEMELDDRSLLIHNLLNQGNYEEVFRNKGYAVCLPTAEK